MNNIKMTLDEAIEHSLEKSKNCSTCAEEHYQLYLWLMELKKYRSSISEEKCNG